MKVFILFFVLIFSFCNNANEQRDIETVSVKKPKVIIPYRGEYISLEKLVDWGAKEGNLKKLGEISFPKGDFEIRIWMSQGVGTPVGTNGLIIKKSDEKWTAFNVDRMMSVNSNQIENKVVNPKSDWKTVWQKLTEADILNLPDSSELENYKGDRVEDGTGYIVEINKDQVYRIYEYRNPELDENPEAKQMVEITKIVAEEFGLEEFYFNNNSGEKLKSE